METTEDENIRNALAIQKQKFLDKTLELRNSLFEIGKWGKNHGNGELIARGTILKEIDKFKSELERQTGSLRNSTPDGVSEKMK